MKPYLLIHPKDNVFIALQDTQKGTVFQDTVLLDDVVSGHKIANQDIQKGDPVIKYGYPIGCASKDIKKGAWVHTHNVVTNLDDVISYSYQPIKESLMKQSDYPVQIYRRNNGKIGIRNELWIIPTVGCVNTTAQIIVDRFKATHDTSDIDGIYVFGHNYGCSQMGDDLENTIVSLQSMVLHPNAGGVLVLGLGCENNQLSYFKETLGEYDQERVRFLESQSVDNEIEEGLVCLRALYQNMKSDQRVEGTLSEVSFGLECGGSDGFSGITANPLLGEFSDYINSLLGRTVLTEVPEMFGAETILMNRAKDEITYEKIVTMINAFKQYYKDHNQVIYDNPSPGNKAGGITTLEDKSLGCTQKSGKAVVEDVLKVGEFLTKKGLHLLYAPGNDLVATTSLGLIGCQMVLFSTGRGTPYGGFIPTVKISTNTALAKKKPHWIDFDAGKLIQDGNMGNLLDEFIQYIVRVINGEKTNNELNNAREIAIFKSGVTL